MALRYSNTTMAGIAAMSAVSFRKNLVGRSSVTGRKTLLFGRERDDGDVFDRYPFDVPSKAGIWEDVMSGRIPDPWNHSNWVIRTDYPPYSGSF